MKIQCKIDFKEGTEQFVKDDVRTVDDAQGQYFVDCGWATNLETGESKQPANGDVALPVDNVVQTLEDK